MSVFDMKHLKKTKGHIGRNVGTIINEDENSPIFQMIKIQHCLKLVYGKNYLNLV